MISGEIHQQSLIPDSGISNSILNNGGSGKPIEISAVEQGDSTLQTRSSH